MLGLCVSAFAAEKADKAETKEAVKEHLENHFKIYGFIRNYFTYDNRESVAGTGDLFYWTPKDEDLDGNGKDLNALSQFRFLSLTSRVGVDVSGYEISGLEFGAKVEADFYAGLTGSTGTAQLRLRQAYLTMKKDGLGRSGKTVSTLKVGQAWHPMGADMPDIFSLETGAPFGAFSRTPLLQEDFSFGNGLSLTAAALWQMQYISMGPNGASADYMKYGMIPEFYLGLSYQKGAFLGRAGVDFLSIKPYKQLKTYKSSALLFAYLQYKKGLFTAKGKTIYGQSGEHLGLMSGYAEYTNAVGNKAFASLNSSSTWLSLSYGKKFMGSVMLGYVQNFGLSKDTDVEKVYFNKNATKALTTSDGIARMFRFEPEFTYNLGKFTVGLEYILTATQFGNYGDNMRLIVSEDLHWVVGNRVQAMVKFTF